MLILLEPMWTPCQWIQAIWDKDWDCTRPAPWRYGLAFGVLASVVVLTYLLHGGKIKSLMVVTRWMHRVENLKESELTDTDLLIAGTVFNLLIAVSMLIIEGFSSFTPLSLFVFSLVYISLFIFRAGKRKEETDPHKDIPVAVRMKTTEELKEYNERLAHLNQTRVLMGEQQSDIPKRVDKLKKLKDLKARLKLEDPDMEGDIDLLIEMERIRELEKNK